jgi:enolase
VHTNVGAAGRASVPSGASTGSREALERLGANAIVGVSMAAARAVGAGCGQIKAATPDRGEHVAKYNRLMDIEDCTLMRFGLRSR